MEKFWNAALAVGGIGTIGAFVLWSLYKDWLHLPIFSQLSPTQTFILMLVFLSFTFASGIAMLIVHLKTENSDRKNIDQPTVTLIGEGLDPMNPSYKQEEKDGKKIITPKGD
jgi:hypothetical protein